MHFIDPIKDLGSLLLKAEKPCRYVGGEFGLLADKNASFKTVIAFPDLYEIGMGNLALKIIYNRLNKLPGILCDRSFAPAPDFEKLLKENNFSLYGLETGLPLTNFNLLLFTLGYELGLNGVLTMLETGNIPLHCSDRKNEHPIVIAGGPVVSNPLPFSPFIDAFWIGEAEAGFFDLVQKLADEKSRGGDRSSLLKLISCHPNIWVKGKEKAVRAIYIGFSADSHEAIFPVPNMKIVQNHGIVEIMRGCPNGCRFCHAGFWYRPMRQKSQELIMRQSEDLVIKGGWQQISLSSLSSGDYCGISELVESLNCKFANEHVSFQLPSLKVSGFALDLLEKISVTRKSGLTFAVETPKDLWQMAINKEVTRDSVIAILQEAKKRGWKSAKFYFMIGLPHKFSHIEDAAQAASLHRDTENTEEEIKEEEEIVNFIIDVSKQTRMKFNINVGVFIPKPHTPYQWAEQIDSEKAREKLYYIRNKLKPLGHKVSTSDILISKIEGLLSRGDERAGYLCEEAYLGGSRLDAWNEYINKEKWKEILNNNDAYLKEINCTQSWSCIDSGVSTEYFQNELEKSNNNHLTAPCAEKCTKCGICNDNVKIIKNPLRSFASSSSFSVNQKNKQVNNTIYRVLFSFSKKDRAIFNGHLNLIDIFSMSLRRANLPVMFTQGFNPLAKMEFASPLSVGIAACNEIASADFSEYMDGQTFIEKLNKNLPCGITVNNAECFLIPHGVKQHSLASLLWGFTYDANCAGNTKDYVPAKEDKNYRKDKDIILLKRCEVLAKNIKMNIKAEDSEYKSYFDIYRDLYNIYK